MDGNCTSYMAQFRDGKHRLEFKEEVSGIAHYVCLDCGETVHQFVDTQGG